MGSSGASLKQGGARGRLMPFTTGSLVRWRKGTLKGDVYGIVIDFEHKSPFHIGAQDGAWVYWPSQKNLVWTACSSLVFLGEMIHSGSLP